MLLNLQNFIFSFKSFDIKLDLKSSTQEHGYHLVDPSPWPMLGAFSGLMVTFGWVLYMHGYSGGGFLWKFGFILVLFFTYV